MASLRDPGVDEVEALADGFLRDCVDMADAKRRSPCGSCAAGVLHPAGRFVAGAIPASAAPTWPMSVLRFDADELWGCSSRQLDIVLGRRGRGGAQAAVGCRDPRGLLDTHRPHHARAEAMPALLAAFERVQGSSPCAPTNDIKYLEAGTPELPQIYPSRRQLAHALHTQNGGCFRAAGR